MAAKISVVIPYYNDPEFIQEALDSVYAQTLKPTEVIIVDDGSTEELPNSVFFCPKWVNFIYIRHDKNEGIGSARRTGDIRASGDWIAHLGSDDRWNKDFLKRCYKAAKKSKKKIVYTDYHIINEFGRRVRTTHETVFKNHTDFVIHAWRRCNVMFSGIFYHREVTEHVDYYDTELRYGEDYLWLLFAMRDYEFEHITEPLADYRIYDKQTTQAVMKDIPANDARMKEIARRYWECE